MYSSSPIGIPNFKALAQTGFETSFWQDKAWWTNWQTNKRMNNPKAICPSKSFEHGGIKVLISDVYIYNMPSSIHYENTPIQIYWKLHVQKLKIFRYKNSNIFLISAQNIDCGYSLEPPRRGGSNEYPQSMFLSRNKKNNVYPCKPQFYYIKVGFKGVNII